MGNRIYLDNELERLLGETPQESETTLDEDLMIDQGDGTKACFNWELRGRGYTLDKQKDDYLNVSDDELLASAYRELNSYRKRGI